MGDLARVLAFDFGASSGRAMLGIFDGQRITLEEVHRFGNDPVVVNGTLYWDTLRQLFEIKQGLVKANNLGPFDSVGIDTWGVDFGLLDEKGYLLENAVHYRDARTNTAVEDMKQVISDEELYGRTGIQFMYFNTLYQLFALKNERPELLERAKTALLTPDLMAYFLTGSKQSEECIASTTALLNPWTKQWDEEIFNLIGVRSDLFPAVVPAGTVAANLSDELCQELGLKAVPFIRVASHDTASAVVSVPAQEDDFIYISSGTWSLMGIESDKPLINEETAVLNYTNEGGYGGKTRYLKNIMGLWLIQEVRRQWIREGLELSYADMERAALEKPAFASFIDADDLLFAPPGDMPNRIRQRCQETGQPVPQDVGEVVRCIYESLALKYRSTKENIEKIVGKSFHTMHVVGGGTKDGLLSQYTANACNANVIAGPIEATATGNCAVQLMALGHIKDLNEARKIILNSFESKFYEPQNTEAWDEAYERYKKIWG